MSVIMSYDEYELLKHLKEDTLAEAYALSSAEDRELNAEWEGITLENIK